MTLETFVVAAFPPKLQPDALAAIAWFEALPEFAKFLMVMAVFWAACLGVALAWQEARNNWRAHRRFAEALNSTGLSSNSRTGRQHSRARRPLIAAS